MASGLLDFVEKSILQEAGRKSASDERPGWNLSYSKEGLKLGPVPADDQLLNLV